MEEKPNYYAIIPANVRYDKELKANAKLMYGEITALSSKYGICTASNNYFARLYEVDASAISKWINQLKDKNYIEVEYETKGKEIKKRIIKIIGIAKCQQVLPNDNGGYCQMNKENNTSNNNTSNKESNNINIITKESFEEIWKQYPKKRGKEAAFKDFTKSIKNGESLEKIRQGLENYIKYIELEKVEQKYIMNGSTWFHQHCWNDDYTVKRQFTTKDLANKIDFSDVL